MRFSFSNDDDDANEDLISLVTITELNVVVDGFESGLNGLERRLSLLSSRELRRSTNQRAASASVANQNARAGDGDDRLRSNDPIIVRFY
jgi:hypothetical protein